MTGRPTEECEQILAAAGHASSWTKCHTPLTLPSLSAVVTMRLCRTRHQYRPSRHRLRRSTARRGPVVMSANASITLRCHIRQTRPPPAPMALPRYLQRSSVSMDFSGVLTYNTLTGKGEEYQCRHQRPGNDEAQAALVSVTTLAVQKLAY